MGPTAAPHLEAGDGVHSAAAHVVLLLLHIGVGTGSDAPDAQSCMIVQGGLFTHHHAMQ